MSLKTNKKYKYRAIAAGAKRFYCRIISVAIKINTVIK